MVQVAIQHRLTLLGSLQHVSQGQSCPRVLVMVLFKKVFVSPALWKDRFPMYFGLEGLFLSALNMSAFRDEKRADNLIEDPLYVTSHNSVAAFKIVLVFSVPWDGQL